MRADLANIYDKLAALFPHAALSHFDAVVRAAFQPYFQKNADSPSLPVLNILFQLFKGRITYFGVVDDVECVRQDRERVLPGGQAHFLL